MTGYFFWMAVETRANALESANIPLFKSKYDEKKRCFGQNGSLAWINNEKSRYCTEGETFGLQTGLIRILFILLAIPNGASFSIGMIIIASSVCGLHQTLTVQKAVSGEQMDGSHVEKVLMAVTIGKWISKVANGAMRRSK